MASLRPVGGNASARGQSALKAALWDRSAYSFRDAMPGASGACPDDRLFRESGGKADPSLWERQGTQPGRRRERNPKDAPCAKTYAPEKVEAGFSASAGEACETLSVRPEKAKGTCGVYSVSP